MCITCSCRKATAKNSYINSLIPLILLPWIQSFWSACFGSWSSHSLNLNRPMSHRWVLLNLICLLFGYIKIFAAQPNSNANKYMCATSPLSRFLAEGCVADLRTCFSFLQQLSHGMFSRNTFTTVWPKPKSVPFCFSPDLYHEKVCMKYYIPSSYKPLEHLFFPDELVFNSFLAFSEFYILFLLFLSPLFWELMESSC